METQNDLGNLFGEIVAENVSNLKKDMSPKYGKQKWA